MPQIASAGLAGPDTVTMRDARVGDLEPLLALYRHLHPDDPEPDAIRAEAAWAGLLGQGPATVCLAERDGRLLASCVLVVVPNLTRGARPFAVIENVVTHPGHRRRGLGRSVLAYAVQAAWRRGCYKVMLATGQADAVAFYESAGFTRGGKTFFEIRPR